jgi:TatD DNase family protein
MIIDSHVNLHGPQFQDDLDAVLARAEAAEVLGLLAICDRLDRFDAVRAVAARKPSIWASVGVHPHHAKDYPDLAAQTLIDLAADPKVIGIGETGLDQHYGYSDLESQIACFRAHIAAARATGLPIIIHTRGADDLTGDILEEEHSRGAFAMLLHCYTGGASLARRAAALGAYFSVSGILTFKAAEDVRAVARAMPQDRVIVETDCPYLAPAPHRGRRNEPAFVVHVLDAFAALSGIDRETAAKRTTEAFFRLFTRAAAPAGLH